MPYGTEVAADNPRIWWKFDETSGTTANDSSTGGTLDGTFAGAFTLNETTAPNGDPAMRITGTTASDKVSVTHASHTPAGYTIEIWVKPYTLANYSCYVNDWASSATGHGNGMMYSSVLGGLGGGQDYTLSGNVYKGIFLDGAAPHRGIQRDILRVGEWTHLVYTNNNGFGIFYRNGKAIAYCYAPIGAATKTSLAYGDCAYAHFAQYDTVLSAARVKAHYEAMVSAPTGMFIVGSTAVEGGNATGDISVPLPYGSQEGDAVIVHSAGNTDSSYYAHFTLDGLTTSFTGLSNSVKHAAAYGVLGATAISNGYLRARRDTTGLLQANRYFSFSVTVVRKATVTTAPGSLDNVATASGGQMFVRTMVGMDNASSVWDVAHNKTNNDAYDLLSTTPQRVKCYSTAWGKVDGASTFSTTRTTGTVGNDYARAMNWVFTLVPDPVPVAPFFRVKRPEVRRALSRATR